MYNTRIASSERAISATALLASLFVAIVVMFATLAHAGGHGHTVTVGDLKIVEPWSRATPKAAKVGAGYLIITNTGSEADRLVSASMPLAGKTELHEMAMADGMTKMREIEGGVEIPAGETVTFKPGGDHLMFMMLSEPLTEGAELTVTLTFEKAGAVEVAFPVGPIGSKEAPAHSH